METGETTGRTRGPDGEIAWRRFGSGPPLVLINGYAATKDDWDPSFLEALGGFCAAVCPDNRGVGTSDPGPGGAELTIGAMAADLIALMDDLSLPSAAVAGWSMGGFIAQELAALAPERVDRLILLATDPGGPAARSCTGETFRKLVDHSGTPHEQARRLLELLFPPDMAARVYSEFGDLVAAARAQLSPEVLTAQEGAMARWHDEEADQRLARIEAQVLVAAGSEDIVIPPVNSDILAASLLGAWLAHFPGGAHAFMAQEPQRLAELIRVFLNP
jgi:pimeloyl-ACP methyl ester carboxylesterase